MVLEVSLLGHTTRGGDEVTEGSEQRRWILTRVEESTVGSALATVFALRHAGELADLILCFCSRHEAHVKEADIGVAERGDRGINLTELVLRSLEIMSLGIGVVLAIGKEHDGAAAAALVGSQFLECSLVGHAIVGF